MGPATPPADEGADPRLTEAVPAVAPIVGAAVDIGSNSVHLLIAALAGHGLQSLVDESAFLGLGAAVAERGFVGVAVRSELVATLVHQADLARALGAETVTFVGTEPLRRAADASRIVHEVGAACDVPLHVLSHEEEAYLTLIGVNEGAFVTQETLVVDVGGGSSEFCVVDRSRPPRAAGLQLGSARLTDRFVRHDPPTGAEVEAMREAALEAVHKAPDASPGEIVAVGGTAANLLKLLPAGNLDHGLDRDQIAEAVAVLTTEPAELVAERYLVRPMRARILPAGAAILDAVLEHYRSERLRVSEAGIREGVILAAGRAGLAWRDQLAQLAHGWRS